MSNLVKMRLKSINLDDIEVMKPHTLGKEYIIDLDSKVKADWFNAEHNHGRQVEIVEDAVEGGYLVFELLELV